MVPNLASSSSSNLLITVALSLLSQDDLDNDGFLKRKKHGASFSSIRDYRIRTQPSESCCIVEEEEAHDHAEDDYRVRQQNK
jgi:hypothetical protein